MGECGGNEICIDGVHPSGQEFATAYCVYTDNILQVLKQNVHRYSHEFTRTWNIPYGNRHLAVGAVLTGVDSKTPLNATSISLQAQSRKEIFDAVSYTTLDGGLAACTDCQSISMQSVPAGTSAFRVSVGLEEGVDAKLFLAWFTP